MWNPGAGEQGLRFTVKDTGIGIAPEAHSRMFAKFSQADMSTTRKYGGTGLGLSICRALVKLMGGTIGFESTLGKGSSFWFTMRYEVGDQVAVDRKRAAEEQAPNIHAHSQRPLQILLAEDNPINQLVAKTLLINLGHQVDVVANGSEAVRAVQQRSYDLVLMDIHMPEVDGVQATRLIRALPSDASDIPIVALTANAMKGDREKYLAAGMIDYLTKPIDRQALAQTLARIVIRSAA